MPQLVGNILPIILALCHLLKCGEDDMAKFRGYDRHNVCQVGIDMCQKVGMWISLTIVGAMEEQVQQVLPR